MSPIERSSPVLLFAAILAIPVIGYGARYLVQAAEPIERMREIGTAATLVCGVAADGPSSSNGGPSKRPRSGCACWRRRVSRRVS
jgi:hypothetical protein